MVEVFQNEELLAQAAVNLFEREYEQAILRSGHFNFVLSGGKTPVRTFELLASKKVQREINWSVVNIFWGDERYVPFSDPRSNFNQAYHAFLSHIPIPANQIHPMELRENPAAAARAYEDLLRNYFRNSHSQFDLVFLGMGEDGHTASLFPSAATLHKNRQWVVYVKNPNENFSRLSLTANCLNKTKVAAFLVSGGAKAEALKNALAKSPPARSIPARLIHPPNGKLLWLVDESAYRSVAML